jgi:hydrogenase nickel incorporation protein HypA/HybF
MHELALSQSIVDLVLEQARAARLRTVTRVAVAVGAAAGIDPEALRFCFDVVVEETMARGAALVIERVRLRARCRSCRQEFEPATRAPAAPGHDASGAWWPRIPVASSCTRGWAAIACWSGSPANNSRESADAPATPRSGPEDSRPDHRRGRLDQGATTVEEATMKRLWILVAVVMIVGFTVLGAAPDCSAS